MGSLPSYPTPIPDGAIDLTPVTVDFTGDANSILGDLGTAADGFDALLAQVAADLASIGLGLSGMDLPLVQALPGGTLNDDPTFQDFTNALTDAINTGTPQLRQYNVDILGNAPPPPGPAPSGGTPPASPVQSANCGTYGQSQILLSDDTTNVDAADALPVVNIQDGKCTFVYLANGSDFMGRADISATALKSGDAQLFAVSNDTIAAATAGGPPTSRLIVTLTPYKTGHFQARFNVTTNRFPTRPEVWWMVVDVINKGSGTAPSGTGGVPTPPQGGGGTGGTPIGKLAGS